MIYGMGRPMCLAFVGAIHGLPLWNTPSAFGRHPSESGEGTPRPCGTPLWKRGRAQLTDSI